MVQTYERNEKTLTSKQLYEIEQAEKRHERELARKRDAKRKAEAFDEIVNAVDESANSYELVARIKLEVLKYQKLEREE